MATQIAKRFDALAAVAVAHGFGFERNGRKFELFSNEFAPGVTEEYESLAEALPDISTLAEGGNPLNSEIPVTVVKAADVGYVDLTFNLGTSPPALVVVDGTAFRFYGMDVGDNSATVRYVPLYIAPSAMDALPTTPPNRVDAFGLAGEQSKGKHAVWYGRVFTNRGGGRYNWL